MADRVLFISWGQPVRGMEGAPSRSSADIGGYTSIYGTAQKFDDRGP